MYEPQCAFIACTGIHLPLFLSFLDNGAPGRGVAGLQPPQTPQKTEIKKNIL
jgi:hypothetical protein